MDKQLKKPETDTIRVIMVSDNPHISRYTINSIESVSYASVKDLE